jgi:RNA polymerase-binding transcription factor DksA
LTDTDQIRRRLQSERERIAGLRDQGVAEQDHQQAGSSELSSLDQHPGDMATETVEREKDQSVLEHFDASLADVDDAIVRLDAGTYGLCERGGDHPVGEERLEALPAARYCVTHQAEVEQEQAAARQ